jgi:tRNA-dihydrouridine synthase A
MPDRRFCVAPMMARTDRHDRFFLRRISRHALLYSEMVTCDALLHGDRARLLDFDASEHPLALQLGGSDRHGLARCAAMAEAWGYDEVNLNVGCPSERVQQRKIGARLMAEPALVAECVSAMSAACDIPVTVKTRIGIDDRTEVAFLDDFVGTVAAAGVRSFIIHARTAILGGLSPKQNRDVPPLDYGRVYKLKRDFPDLEIVINGGIASLDEAMVHLAQVDGVMLGRAAYETPYLLAEVDRRIFGDTGSVTARDAVVESMLPYIDRQRAAGVPLSSITRHMLGLFRGCRGGRAWRRCLSENAHRSDAGSDVVRAALDPVIRDAA